jgi:hypothetical protein
VVKIDQKIEIAQIEQVKGQIICKLSKDLKKTILGGIQGVPTKIQGVPKNVKKLKIAQIGQVKGQITSTKSQDV